MIEGIISLASYGFAGGGSFGNLLAQWDALGIFSYVLPFLLIFALVFLILGSIPLFQGNKGVSAIIALSVALMALQFNFVSVFFSEIFPRFGIALAIILVLVIVGGLFFDPQNKGFGWLYTIIGLIITAVVVFKSLTYFGWYTGNTGWFNVYWPNILIVIAIIAAIGIVIGTSKPKEKKWELPEVWPPIFKQK